jgi:predicted regulator of Ras-like GTPase activity (Roadblock/LC7/MglB family)
MAKHDALKNHLDNLRNAIPELKGVLLASVEGLPVAHALSNGMDANRVAAMAAAASSLGRRISDSMSTGLLNEVSVKGDDGMLFVYAAGTKAVLAVIGPSPSNAGLIHLEARSTAKEIAELF